MKMWWKYDVQFARCTRSLLSPFSFLPVISYCLSSRFFAVSLQVNIAPNKVEVPVDDSKFFTCQGE